MADADRAAASKENRVRFHYRKSQSFRVIHVDGAYGGMSPTGDIHLSLYSERFPIPRITSLPLSAAVIDTAETIEDRIEGVVREVEVDAVMDLPTAIAIHHWLLDKLAKMKAQMKIPDEDWASMRGPKV